MSESGGGALLVHARQSTTTPEFGRSRVSCGCDRPTTALTSLPDRRRPQAAHAAALRRHLLPRDRTPGARCASWASSSTASTLWPASAPPSASSAPLAPGRTIPCTGTPRSSPASSPSRASPSSPAAAPASWRPPTGAPRRPTACRSAWPSTCPTSTALNPYVDLSAILPLLLRAQDDVRQVRPGLRHLPRRLRHLRRAVRVADAGADGQDRPLPHHPLRQRVLGGPARVAALDGRAAGQRLRGRPGPLPRLRRRRGDRRRSSPSRIARATRTARASEGV